VSVGNLTARLNGMAYTLGEAARATGKSKAAISQAIANNKISATKDANGRYQIDPAELHRLYPMQKTIPNEREHLLTHTQTAEIERLKATVEGLERLCQQIEGERDSLREQNTRLTALLTNQREQTAPAKRRWWSFGTRA
jgi:chromosome segregation ATPase